MTESELRARIEHDLFLIVMKSKRLDGESTLSLLIDYVVGRIKEVEAETVARVEPRGLLTRFNKLDTRTRELEARADALRAELEATKQALAAADKTIRCLLEGVPND